MSSNARLAVGIVGCGYQGNLFAQSLADSDQWKIVACADPDGEAASRLARSFGEVAPFSSVTQMLELAELDAVVVAPSHDALCESALAAIHAGKHVLLEKPLGLNETQAARLEAALEGSPVCLMAGYSFRYIAAWQKVHELLRAGAVGKPHTLMGAIGVGPMTSGWKANRETGGGPLLYVGSHLVDQMLWYAEDEPVEVSAEIRMAANSGVDETTTFQLKFRGGAVAQGMVTQTAHAGLNSHLGIYGPKGRIALRGAGFNYGVEVASSALDGLLQPTTFQIPQTEDLRLLMHQPQLAEFAEAIREGRQPSCTLAEGRRVLKVLDAIRSSAESARPVKV